MDTLGVVAGLLGSGSLGAVITALFNRGKNKVELQRTVGELYGGMIEDCRKQLDHQANQIRQQAEQILMMQSSQVEYLKVISGHQATERELRAQIKHLETKLGNRIDKLEEQTQ